ncbi:hypothetical protein ASD21_22975 [Caulobacter sp. Root1455]|uniref:hypothetical protein n=1 Tax=Caulobacter sp. Root1455 TaxID=1736465 RepID=UPI0006F257E8|nr:hypothetical protein [Caulobacter sp. Root1455]KQY96875.1 hypothetical protein ASD21_22975 [Caulobacter sp. Root1455]
MRTPLDLRLVNDDEAVGDVLHDEAPGVAAPPRVFARAVQTPAGWPWEQVRGAQLAARHQAPLPMDQVCLRLKRLTPWRPVQGALFAACYVRASEIQERFEAEVQVEGRPARVVFEPPEALARRARRSLLVGVAAAAVASLLFVSVAGALLARAQGEEQLAVLEHDAAVKLQRVEAAQLVRRQSAALAAASPGDRVAVPLTDLAWAMAARKSDARIEAWRWDHGVSRVQARDEASPFADPRRAVTRQDVGIWRVEPEGDGR